jgi:type III secretory pathway component EscS
MELTTILDFCQRGLLMAFWVTAPVVITAALVGLMFAALQAVTQLQDQTMSTIAKLAIAGGVLAVSGGWLAVTITHFTDEMWTAAGMLPTSR